jgi:hypothetical protein
LASLNPYVSEIIEDKQCGFRHNISTTDEIFYIWQMLEKKWDFNAIVHQIQNSREHMSQLKEKFLQHSA